MRRVLVFGIIVLFLREGLSTAEVESSSITGTLSEIDRLLTVNKRAERGRRECTVQFVAFLFHLAGKQGNFSIKACLHCDLLLLVDLQFNKFSGSFIISYRKMRERHCKS